MATFCKTSQGGFNLEHVSHWSYLEDGKGGLTVYIYLLSTTPHEQITLTLEGAEAKRAFGILSGVSIFDTIQERKP